MYSLYKIEREQAADGKRYNCAGAGIGCVENICIDLCKMSKNVGFVYEIIDKFHWI